jgi:acetyl-CoA C-acetyltransferase
MPQTVHILGSARTDFRRNLAKEGSGLREIIVEAGRAALLDADIEPTSVRSGVLGNFAAGQFSGQNHLGSFLTDIDDAMRGMPTLRTEAACASGSVAVLTAIHQIAGGLYDVVLVVGAEQQKTMSPAQGADVLASAGDYLFEKPSYGPYVFPSLFGRIAQVYRDRFGLSDMALAAVAVKNRLHATLNPLAQLRDAKMTIEQACMVSETNAAIAPPLKLCDCSQISDGAAAVVLCSGEFLAHLNRKSAAPRLLGFGHTTDHLPLEKKDAPLFSIARQAADSAYRMAALTPKDIQAADVHDCFSITEIVASELLSFAAPGHGAALAESGATGHPSIRSHLHPTPGGPAPIINPGGGLIADGHPVGATGVRQVVEAHQHLTGRAGKRQVDGVRNYLTFNMGGTLTTNVAMIWGA